MKAVHQSNTCIYFHLTAFSDRENLLLSVVSLRSSYRLRKPTDRTTIHLSHHTLAHSFYFFPVCLSSLHILSHAPSLTSHLLSLCLSPVSMLSCFIFCPSLAVTYFSFSTVSFSHIPATSTVACHHPGSHSSSLYHLLNHSCFDITGL